LIELTVPRGYERQERHFSRHGLASLTPDTGILREKGQITDLGHTRAQVIPRSGQLFGLDVLKAVIMTVLVTIVDFSELTAFPKNAAGMSSTHSVRKMFHGIEWVSSESEMF
jgi:hypothetical protein